MKKNKNAYYVVIAIIIVLGSIVIWRVYSGQKEIKPETASQNQTANLKTEGDTRVFFASNGKDKVYKIKRNDKWSVIWNGKEGKSYDYVSNPVFSADGTQLAYSAELDGQSWVVLNNEQEFFAYKKATSLVFSPDGKKLAFVAIKGSTSVVIVNGQESQEYESIASFETPAGTTSIIFSPDGQQIIYVVTEGEKSYIVINGEKGEAFDSITGIYFDENNQLVYEASNGDEVVTVINNEIIDSNPAPENSETDPAETETPEPNPYLPAAARPYRYKISTQKDIDLSGDDSTDYEACSPGADCNF